MSEYEGIFFDLDGTLVVLDVDIERAREQLSQLFAAHGVHMRFAPILASIDRAALMVPAQGERLRAQALGLLADAERDAARRAAPAPGAASAVLEACRRGAVAIVSNNSRDAVEIVAAKLPPRLVAVGREDARPKPDPSMLLVAQRRVGGRRGRYLMVGDSPVDVEAARRASDELGEIEVVAVLGGRSSREELEAAAPDRIIAGLNELWR